MAKYLEVTSIRKDDGVTFKKGNMEFSKGKIVREFKKTTIKKPSKNTHVGTTISFIPDETIFGEEKAKFNIEKIKHKLELKTYLNAGLTINLTVDGVKTKFYHKNGIVDYIRTMVKEPLYNMDTIYFSGKDEDENSYEISMILNNDLDEHIVGFVNSLSLENGGTHETGFKKGMTRVFLDYIKNNNMLSGKDKNLNIKGEDIRRGLICVISIKHDNPLYDGQTKDKLTNTDIDPKVAKIVTDNLSEWLEKNTKLAKAICNRIIAFARATSSTKEKMKKIVSVSQNSSGLELTEKFMDCETVDADECEIFIIEGDSASGGCEGGRDYRFQALYPLRGKILNTNNATSSKIMDNKELNEFLKIEFGTNDLKKIRQNLNKLLEDGDESKIDISIRSKKIIVLTDGDSDGSHITILFLNFINEHLPEMIDLGWIYIGSAPLYRVNIKGKFEYFKDDNEYNEFITKYISENYKIETPKFSVKRLMNHYDKYIEEFNIIKNKYDCHKDVLNIILHNDDPVKARREIKEKCHIKTFKSGNVEGNYDSVWNEFNVNEVYDDIDDIKSIFKTLNKIEVTDKKSNETLELDIYDALIMLRKSFKYTRNRLKGLGEMDGDELSFTSLNPETRVLIKVMRENMSKENRMCEILFGNNSNLRKDFIQEHLI